MLYEVITVEMLPHVGYGREGTLQRIQHVVDLAAGILEGIRINLQAVHEAGQGFLMLVHLREELDLLV